MPETTMQDVAAMMRDIDFTMLFTRTEGGALAGRPMSNNREVEYDGDSHFFAYDTTRTVADIEREPQVAMSLQGQSGADGAPPVFIAVQGEARIIRDKAAFEAHWVPGLERWFPEGVDTPGLVLLKVRATRVHYWDGEDEGDLVP
jgi:general stress protein 26